MSDLFEEIREDLVKSKYENIWKSYGKYFVTGLIFVAAISLWLFLGHEQKKRKMASNTSYLYAILQNIENADYQKLQANSKFLLDEGEFAHKSYVILKNADSDIASNQIANAYSDLLSLYNDKSAYKPHRDYAELLLNYIIFKYPTDQYQEQQIVNNINVQNIFYYSILEIRAMSFIEHGKISEAINELDKIISEQSAPERNRVFAKQVKKILEAS